MKYSKGFYFGIFNCLTVDLIFELKKLSQKCEEFIVGIPSDYILSRIYNKEIISSEKYKELISELRFISEVVIIEAEDLNFIKLHKKFGFDVYFYGSEYGQKFERDMVYAIENKIEMVSLIPSFFSKTDEIESLQLALKNVQKDKKIILFGTGKYFDIYMKYFADKHKPSYAIDSSTEKIGKKKNGVEICSVERLKNEDVNNVLVIICVKDYISIKKVLLSYGNFDFRTLLYHNSTALIEEFSLIYSNECEYLREAHRINILMMKELDRVCRKYDIPYYIICGSLIGVVRHKGLIPWDDDVDVAFTRQGFEKLKEVARLEWVNGDFSFINCGDYGNGAFLDFLVRLVYNKERLPVKIFDKVENRAAVDVKNKMCIDLYIFEEAGVVPEKHYKYVKLMQLIYVMCMGHRGKIDLAEYGRLPNSKYTLLKFLVRIGSVIPLKFLIGCYEHLRGFAKKENSDYYFCANLSITCIDRRIKKSFLGNGCEMMMEDIKVIVPEDYNGFLESMNYHNYMSYPPLHIRKPSHYFNADISIW